MNYRKIGRSWKPLPLTSVVMIILTILTCSWQLRNPVFCPLPNSSTVIPPLFLKSIYNFIIITQGLKKIFLEITVMYILWKIRKEGYVMWRANFLIFLHYFETKWLFHPCRVKVCETAQVQIAPAPFVLIQKVWIFDMLQSKLNKFHYTKIIT